MFTAVAVRALITDVRKHGRRALVHGEGSSMKATASTNRMRSLLGSPSRRIFQGRALRGLIPCLKPKLGLVLFLAFTFFLLCPLWAYLSFCGIGAYRDASQDCFLYNAVFNMPMSLPTPAIPLFIMASFLVIARGRPFPVFGAPRYRILTRAPPLS